MLSVSYTWLWSPDGHETGTALLTGLHSTTHGCTTPTGTALLLERRKQKGFIHLHYNVLQLSHIWLKIKMYTHVFCLNISLYLSIRRIFFGCMVAWEDVKSKFFLMLTANVPHIVLYDWTDWMCLSKATDCIVLYEHHLPNTCYLMATIINVAKLM